MKLTTIVMFLVKIRATFMFITFKIIEKQESYKIRGLKKKKKNNSRVFLVFFKFKFSNIMSHVVLIQIKKELLPQWLPALS